MDSSVDAAYVQSSHLLASAASEYQPRILLVDDVWTTGTTLLRCSQRLLEAGAREVRVLALFRSLSSNR